MFEGIERESFIGEKLLFEEIEIESFESMRGVVLEERERESFTA